MFLRLFTELPAEEAGGADALPPMVPIIAVSALVDVMMMPRVRRCGEPPRLRSRALDATGCTRTDAERAPHLLERSSCLSSCLVCLCGSGRIRPSCNNAS